MRFSGHDTFHCKEQWLLKGLQFIDNQNIDSPFRSAEAINELGVGKNMVRSIHYWLKSFALIDEEDTPTFYSDYIFKKDEGGDRYLENPATLFILQYLLTSKEYASIYSLVFRDFFRNKANQEFTELQVTTYIKRVLSELEIRKFNDNTIRSDFKVFVRTYVPPKKNIKTLEDDFSAPLLDLKLVSDTGRKNDLNQPVYRINKAVRPELSEYAFAFCVVDFFDKEVAIDFTDIANNIGSFLCLSNEGLEEILGRLCQSDKRFVFKSDAGVKQLQLKQNDLYIKEEMLNKIYGE
jgi:hypothetical protein